MAMNISFSAALIHHQLISRAANRSQLYQLFESLDIQLSEIFYQPLIGVNRTTLLDRLWVASRSLLKIVVDALLGWLSGRDSISRCLKRCLVEPIRLVQYLAFISSDEWISLYRTCMVEGFLVKKHISAWNMALIDNADWLFVLEDDAEILSDTSLRLRDLISNQTLVADTSLPAYLDLAGGYEPTTVLPTRIPGTATPTGWRFTHIRTNTTCAYLVSKTLIRLWLTCLSRHSWLLQLPADHLINAVSMVVCWSRRDCMSRHWRRPLFLHGSFHADFKSTISGSR